MQPKILLVDDREDNLLSIETILEPSGYQFVKANSGRQALKILLTEFDFAMILMDVKMPKHDGLFLMREIKKNWPDIPIIVMSGYPTPETVVDVVKLGATHFIPKPFRPDELVKSIRMVLQKMVKKESFPTGAGG